MSGEVRAWKLRRYAATTTGWSAHFYGFCSTPVASAPGRSTTNSATRLACREPSYPSYRTTGWPHWRKHPRLAVFPSRPLTAREIQEEVRRRGLPERKDANPHLSTLERKGFITSTPSGWCRVELASGHASSPPPQPTRSSPRSRADAAPPPPAPHAPPTSRAERLQSIKLVLEIGVVAVTLIGGIIALVLGSR